MAQLRLEVTHRVDLQPLGPFLQDRIGKVRTLKPMALPLRWLRESMATNRKPEQTKEAGAVGGVHVTDEQLVQASPEDEHDRPDEVHI